MQCTLKSLIGVPSKSVCCVAHCTKYDRRCAMVLTTENSLKQSKKFDCIIVVEPDETYPNHNLIVPKLFYLFTKHTKNIRKLINYKRN